MSISDDERKNIPARYEQVEKLGSGGVGNVYRARDSYMDRLVAIKLLNASYRKDSQIRFQREAKAASRLKHPNLVTILDFGFGEQNQPYLVMQYVSGPTLKQLLVEKGALSISEACKHIIEVLKGLEHAHAAGVLHRDIKPANIVIDGQGEARVLDFGLAKMLEDDQELTSTGVALGTPYYMSPEQANCQSVDHRADIYSVGCVLFECLTGSKPFAGATAHETIMMHIAASVPGLGEYDPGLPVELDTIVARALAKSPEERYQSAGEMASAISGFINDGENGLSFDDGYYSAAASSLEGGSIEPDPDRSGTDCRGDRVERRAGRNLQDNPEGPGNVPFGRLFSAERLPKSIVAPAAIVMAGCLVLYGLFALFGNHSAAPSKLKRESVFPIFRVECLSGKAKIVIENTGAMDDGAGVKKRLACLRGVRQIEFDSANAAGDDDLPVRVRLRGLLSTIHEINPTVSRVLLSNLRLDRADVEILARFGKLDYLCLRNNALDDGAVAPLAELDSFRFKIPQSIENLNLNKTLVLKNQFITDRSLRFVGALKGLKALYVGKNPSIKGPGLRFLYDLDLSVIGLSDTGCAPAQILDLLKHQNQLKSLSLGGLNLNDSQLQAMVAACPNLNQLSVSSNPITDVSLDYILANCKNLKWLDVRKCYGISDSGLQKLKAIGGLTVNR